MKTETLKKVAIIAFVILLSLVALLGINVRKSWEDTDILPEYIFGIGVKGYRQIEYSVDSTEKAVVHEKDDGHNHTEEELAALENDKAPVNSAEVLTLENYNYAKDLIAKRLDKLKATEYLIRENTANGTITLELPDDNFIDVISTYIAKQGKFRIVDSETKEVLLNNSHLKTSLPTYGTNASGQYEVYIKLEFTKEGKEILKEVSTKYNSSENEAGETVTKKVKMTIDDEEIMESHFSEVISDGLMQVRIGQSTKGQNEFQAYIDLASGVSTLLTNEELPIVYNVTANKYISSEFDFKTMITILGVIFILTNILLIVKYKAKGIIAAISTFGFIALLMIIIRLVNIIVTIEVFFGIGLGILINFMMLNKILKSNITKDSSDLIVDTALIIIPILLITIVLIFNVWNPMASFAMSLFWGIFIMYVYNFSITKNILSSKTINKKGGKK